MTVAVVNASNLHVGGGVAVAVSFLDILARDKARDCGNIVLLVSTTCFRNLLRLGTNLDSFQEVIVFDSRPRKAWALSRILYKLRPYLIFTIFGPTYSLIPSNTILVSGIANPFLIFPRNNFCKTRGLLSRLRSSLFHLVPSLVMHRVNHLICETNAAKDSLSTLYPGSPISVVPSGFHDIYLFPDRWEPIAHSSLNTKSLKLGLIACNYPHKNLGILQNVLHLLRAHFNLDVDIFVTLTHHSFVRTFCLTGPLPQNVGQLSLAQCPTFYSSMDAIIFPSLLESFSAVTLEALIMRCPLFVSDITNVNEPCSNHCIKFDPDDTLDIASKVVSFFSLSSAARHLHIDKAYQYALSLSSSGRERASSYLNILESYGAG